MKTLKTKSIRNYVLAQLVAIELKDKIVSKLTEERGDEFVSKGIIIAICVAVGGLVLGFMTGLFKDTIAPQTTESIKGFFNHT